MGRWLVGFVLVSSLGVGCGKSVHNRPSDAEAAAGGQGEAGADLDAPGASGDRGSGGSGSGIGASGNGGVSASGANAGGTGAGEANVSGAGGVGVAGEGQAGNAGEGGAHEPFPDSPNTVFVTSKRYVPAQLGGLEGADSACNTLATAAGLKGTFVAWLSTSTVDAKSRLGGANAWYNTHDRPFAGQAAALLDENQVYFPVNYDEHGNKVYGDVATGTTADGTASPANCGDWTTNSANAALVVGDANSGSVLWTFVSEQASCDGEYRLYCFQVDHSVAIYPTPSEGRTVFVSSKPFELGPNGRAGADTLCAADAAAANLNGTFVALLPTSTEPATERLIDAGRPWVRYDGMVVANGTGDVALGVLDTPVTQQADGVYVGGLPVWGGPKLDVSSTFTCDDWTNTNAATTAALSGLTGYTDARYYTWQMRPCSDAQRVLCVER